MTEDQIKHMVDRFLAWKLPEDFSPDAGISFEPEYNVEWNAQEGRPPSRHEPTGTNLFDATQAREMVLYMLDGAPSDAGKLREALRELHDYALKEITRPSAHHDPVWAKVADVLAGETSYGAQ